MLKESFTPHTEQLDDHPDEELKWCYVKNENLKKDPKFSQMYLLDEQNRTAILYAVEKRIAEFPMPLLQPPLVEEPALSEDETQPAAKTILFLEVLKPIMAARKKLYSSSGKKQKKPVSSLTSSPRYQGLITVRTLMA